MTEITPTLLTIIAGLLLIAQTLVQSWISARKEKRDYARQDEVAARVAHLHQENIKKSDEIAALAKSADERIRKHLKVIDKQGKQIHILVNSDMTAARTSERDQVQSTLVALKRVQVLNRKLKIVDTPEELETLESTKNRIIELNAILSDREAAFRLLTKQEEEEKQNEE